MTTAETDDFTGVLERGRSSRIDWLGVESSRQTIAEALMAFANTRHGGSLLIGVNDDGHPQGIDEAVSIMDRTLQAALMLTPALILPLPRVIDIDGQRVILAQVPPGMSHVYGLEGRYLVRSGADNQPLTPPMLRRLLIERGDITFETEAAQGCTLQDLNWPQAKAYAETLGERDVEAALLRRGCLTRDDQDRLVPTNAGLLLFGKSPQSTLRGCEITAVRFAGSVMSDSFSRQDITGTLPEQIRRAETFLRDEMRRGVQLSDSMARTEHFEYPLEAVRELVVNSVAHRDYSIQGDGIRLYMFADRMEITSPGKLPGPVTIDNIRDERFSRNPALVQVLADMRFIERLGYGVDRVIDLMRQQGLRAPEFTETDGGFRVTIFNDQASPVELPTEPQNVDLLQQFRGVPFNPRQESVLTFLGDPANTRITNSELQKMHPDVHPETIRRDLSDLVAKDILTRMGEKRGSYYVLRSTL
jgi:ATP-dependent DNA helicase RecG